MKIAGLLLMSALMVGTGFAATRLPVAVWSQSGENRVNFLAASHGVVAVSYNIQGVGSTNMIQLYQDLGTWQQIATLTVSDGNAVVYAVALTEDYLVTGTYDGVSEEGAAYIFVKPSGGWQNATETAKLRPSNPSKSNGFGASVAAWGPTIVVGSTTGGPAGAAYVYERPAGGWVNATENAKLRTTAQGNFYSVAISGAVGGDGSEIALGAPAYGTAGTVYVFQKPANGWTNMAPTAKLTNRDGKAGDNLGRAVAMSSGVIVAGAPHTASKGRGALAVYVRPQGGWANTSRPTALLTDPWSFRLGDYAVGITVGGGQIAACCGGPSGLPHAYLFTEPSGGWTSMTSASLKLKLTQPSDGAYVVSITKGFAAVGAFNNSRAAGTYIFKAQ